MLKFECDNCHQVVYHAEAIGPGVLKRVGEGVEIGKTYTYQDPESEVTVRVQLEWEGDNNGQFCLACMWKMLRQMVNEWGPNPEELAEKFAKIEAERRRKIEEVYFEVNAEVEDKVKEEVKEVPNEETSDGTPDADTQLPELHAEGVLSESGPDVPTIYPKPIIAENVFTRHGWRHPHLP